MKTCDNCEHKEVCDKAGEYCIKGKSWIMCCHHWQGWIKCEDELPPKHKVVLIASQDSLKHKIEIHTSEIEDDGNWRWSPQYVYAWRPLPKYEEENNIHTIHN